MPINLSIFSYIFAAISSIAVSFYLEKELNQSQNKYRYYTLFVAVVILLSILPGLRASFVGIDTENYLNAIFYMLNKNNVWYRSEPGLFLLSRLTVLFTKNPHAVLMISSLFINTLIILGLIKHKENISIPFALSVYIFMFYLETFNIMRQWLAISIVFYAYHFLYKDNYLKFVVFILIATLFHNTALIASLILMIDILSKTQLEDIFKFIVKNKKKMILAILIITIILVLLGIKLNLLTRFKYIFSEKNVSGNYGLLGWVRLSLGMWLVYLIYMNNKYKDRLYLYYVLPYLVLLITEVGFYTSRFTLRLFLYMSSIQILTIGFIAKESKKYKNYYYFLIPYYLLNIALFINYILNGRGILPYSFFWQ